MLHLKPALESALREGYRKANEEMFRDTSLKVFNFTHNDLDGGVAGIVVKNVYPNATTALVNYGGPDYTNAVELIRGDAQNYDAIIFSDWCPDMAKHADMYEVLDNAGIPFLVIDHHPNAKNHPEDPLGIFVIDTGKCGALGCLDYFSNIKDLEYLRSLCVVTDDHDRWIRKILPLSDQLNNLYFLHGAQEFMAKYMHGLEGNTLPEDDLALLQDHDREVTEYFAQFPQHGLPANGYFIECGNFMSDIVVRLSEKYDWLVIKNPKEASPGITKLSFRTRRKDVNLNEILGSLGRGGGGHPGAAGQILPTADVDEFIAQVADIIAGK